jgi:hypothetical protein
MLKPSEEQQEILNTLERGYNVVADCVAGSGKTTSVLMIAAAFAEKRIVQITYNSQLKSEVRQRVAQAGLGNIEIHTYHSLVVRYYDPSGYDDTIIRRVVSANAAPSSRLPAVDILIVDEAQDMTFLYYTLIRKFQRDLRTTPQIVVLGDKFQGIYKFKDADPRYLTLSGSLWDAQDAVAQEPQNFIPVGLTTSYRATHQIADFVNRCMLGSRRIRAVRGGPPVEYHRINIYAAHKRMRELIQAAMDAEDGGIRAEDIFVLAGSIRSDTSPVRKLENALVEAGIPCYFPMSDDTKLDEDVVRGKVVFSTFHQAKGRERKLVILYGFDASYFRFFGKDYDPVVCPETLYVGATRASERLVLLENAEEGPLPFLQALAPAPFLNIRVHGRGGKETTVSTKTQGPPSPTLADFGFIKLPTASPGPASASASAPASAMPLHRTTVSDLTRFLNETNLSLLINILNELYEEEVECQYEVKIPTKVAFSSGTVEEVADINGIVIPAMYEARLCTSSTVEIDVRNRLVDITTNDSYKYIQEACRKLRPTVATPEEYCYMVLIYIAMTEGLYNKLEQIKHCRWLTEEMVAACFVALEKHLTADTIFEESVVLACEEFEEYGCVEIAGRMDAINDDCVWEFKCTETISTEHLLQLAVYAFLWSRVLEEEHGPREFRILNLRTGQIFRLVGRRSHLLSEMMRVLFHNKFAKQDTLSDAEFVERCRKGVAPHRGIRRAIECVIYDDE